ncbi:hypothetical protein O6H91_01G086500 [Diphasiastrum complanatum]|uniref:Uncharacterized protein n=2 Tax=Diphasiastrum complanatum TaxID=34168 RepID=A0ACC2ET23_DIPCM|nr:hypothetical protein O6H91_01G086500 [Diphasiastrum complanatum]
MVGGIAPPATTEKEYSGRTTTAVVLACAVAATGGLIFGYDLGISGGVISMDDFLQKFFPIVVVKKKSAHENHYCKYDNQGLQAFTSSLYLAGLVSTLFASYITSRKGRRFTMIAGGLSFLTGSCLNAAAQNLGMLIIGRIMLGVGVGFSNQAVPLYLSEMAPAKLRGGLNVMFQLAVGYGVLSANLINYGTSKLKPWGWRLSLGLAAVPSSMLTFGSLLLSDTPNSLIERGYLKEGQDVLQKIRGVSEVNVEFSDLVEASRLANQVKHPFLNILERRNRPQFAMALFIPLFQQMTGINVITFYAPEFFQAIGFGSSSSLYSAVILGILPIIALKIMIWKVDKWGRRGPFIWGGFLMFICQMSIGSILGFKFTGTSELSKGWAVVTMILMCMYVVGFGCSWGPLGWLVPSEIFPLDIRSASQSINVSIQLFFTFAVAQVFLSMFCHMRYGIFFFFGGWVAIMTIFVYLFLPETKNVPIEQMVHVWQQHWYWKKFSMNNGDVSPDMDGERKVQVKCPYYESYKRVDEIP